MNEGRSVAKCCFCFCLLEKSYFEFLLRTCTSKGQGLRSPGQAYGFVVKRGPRTSLDNDVHPRNNGSLLNLKDWDCDCDKTRPYRTKQRDGYCTDPTTVNGCTDDGHNTLRHAPICVGSGIYTLFRFEMFISQGIIK